MPDANVSRARLFGLTPWGARPRWSAYHCPHGQPVGAAPDGGTAARDRAGGDAARLRVRVRAPGAAPLGGDRRPEPACPRPAPPRDARRARPVVREVRPAPLDPSRHRAGRDPRRAPPAPGRGHAVPVRRCRADDRGGPAGADRQALHGVRPDAGRGGLDRPGAPRRASQPPPRRRQGAAARGSPPDRARPGAALSGRAHRQAPRRQARLHRPGRGRRRVRPVDPPRVRLPDRGAHRRDLPPELRLRPARRHPQGVRHVLERPGADARAARGDPARRPRPRRDAHGGAPPARDPDRRDVARDDLPPRPLPRRSASRRTSSCSADGPARPRRLRHDRSA